MAVYSPSACAAHSFCPQRAAFERDRWRRRPLTHVDVAAALGSAFAAGMAAHYQARLPNATVPTHPPTAAADAAQHIFAVHEETGRVVDERDKARWADMPHVVAKLVKLYIAQDPVPPSWEVVDVERSFVKHGYARADLILMTPTGLAVADHKVKMHLQARDLPREVWRRRWHWWARNHYTWALEETVGKPCDRFIVYVVVAAPSFHLEVVDYTISPEERRTWLTSARQQWHDIAEEIGGRRVITMTAREYQGCEDCPFQIACHEQDKDPHLMQQSGEYVQVKRRV